MDMGRMRVNFVGNFENEAHDPAPPGKREGDGTKEGMKDWVGKGGRRRRRESSHDNCGLSNEGIDILVRKDHCTIDKKLITKLDVLCKNSHVLNVIPCTNTRTPANDAINNVCTTKD